MGVVNHSTAAAPSDVVVLIFRFHHSKWGLGYLPNVPRQPPIAIRTTSVRHVHPAPLIPAQLPPHPPDPHCLRKYFRRTSRTMSETITQKPNIPWEVGVHDAQYVTKKIKITTLHAGPFVFF